MAIFFFFFVCKKKFVFLQPEVRNRKSPDVRNVGRFERS